MKNYLQTIESLTKWLNGLIWAILGVKVLFLILYSYSFYMFKNLYATEYYGDAMLQYTKLTMFMGIVSVVHTVLFITIIVFFLVWLVNMCNYLREHEYVSTKSPFIVIYWFIPIISLFKPYQVIRELYKKLQAILIKNNRRGDVSLGGLVGLWWFLWIVVIAISVATPFIALNNLKDIDFDFTMTINLISNFIFIIVTFLFLRIILRFSDMAEEFSEINWDGEEVDLSGHIID
ncbi:MAG: DUF4328 domain-containing protein [Bacteroidota bacterium]